MNIVLKGNGNVYEQIVEQYKKYITLGVFKDNDKLPSCRALAKDLGINPNTVERAYRVLEEEGFITVIPKKGVYVSYQNNSHKNYIIEHIEELKRQNVSYDELINVINLVYKGEDVK